MKEKYEFTPKMTEISGFGGGYEKVCRDMVKAGLEWFDEHPNAKPEFKGYKGVFGIISENNEDAKALTKVVLKASGGDCTGAMHQATISHILWIQAHSWAAYVKEMEK